MTAPTTPRGIVRRGVFRRPTRGALLSLMLVPAVLLSGCTDDGAPAPREAAPMTVEASPVPPLPAPADPGGAPLVDIERPDGAGAPSGSSGDDDEDDRKRKDKTKGDPGMDAPTTFPSWMTRPTPNADLCPRPTVRVRDADQLHEALELAGPGTSIWLEPGIYHGTFVTTASGTAAEPAALCGTAQSILNGNGLKGDYVLHLDGAEHWVLSGFTVRNGQKGVMADGTTGTTISGLTVYGIGDEAIHLRRHSTRNVVAHNTISDTGLRKEKFGEGVYIGSANSNWQDLTGGEPDRSDDNQIIANAIYATSSEAVDVKEGTTGGVVADNQFDGSRITGADSWVDIKGNDWTIAGNVGRHTPLDGFQTHDVANGWGTRNTFTGNSGQLSDREGFLIALRPVNENRALCDNRLLGGVGSLTNKGCR